MAFGSISLRLRLRWAAYRSIVRLAGWKWLLASLGGDALRLPLVMLLLGLLFLVLGGLVNEVYCLVVSGWRHSGCVVEAFFAPFYLCRKAYHLLIPLSVYEGSRWLVFLVAVVSYVYGSSLSLAARRQVLGQAFQSGEPDDVASSQEENEKREAWWLPQRQLPRVLLYVAFLVACWSMAYLYEPYTLSKHFDSIISATDLESLACKPDAREMIADELNHGSTYEEEESDESGDESKSSVVTGYAFASQNNSLVVHHRRMGFKAAQMIIGSFEARHKELLDDLAVAGFKRIVFTNGSETWKLEIQPKLPPASSCEDGGEE